MTKLFLSILVLVVMQSGAWADKPQDKPSAAANDAARQMVQQSIKKYKIAEDVSVDDAIESMKLRANMLNFKMVADLPLSEQVKAMGEKANYMRILAFCDALIAKKMVEYDPIFAGFLPCRVAVIEDSKKQGWIITMNMDMMLNAVDLTPELVPLAEQVRDTINSIVDAGVNGDL
ncbi:MAG TPA: DUF302 domain-containing protein [Chromatiales bacterium]|nr:DUF302 domain-containing protein [Thiotrichales bacterium]HIP68740.1 DUF302 domain-containing protein [Chromatiales bacterium]